MILCCSWALCCRVRDQLRHGLRQVSKLIMVVYAIDDVVLGSVFCCAAVFRCRLFVVLLLPRIFLVFFNSVE